MTSPFAFLEKLSKSFWKWLCNCVRASPGVLSTSPRTVKLDEEKSKCAGLDQENGFGSQHNCTVCRGWWKDEPTNQCCAPAEKNVINVIWLLLSIFDWPIIMIAPCGLLSVVPHLFAVPVSVLRVRLQTK